jgi:hypothetical protein
MLGPPCPSQSCTGGWQAVPNNGVAEKNLSTPKMKGIRTLGLFIYLKYDCRQARLRYPEGTEASNLAA